MGIPLMILRRIAPGIVVAVALLLTHQAMAQPTHATDEAMNEAAGELYADAKKARSEDDWPKCLAKARAAYAIHERAVIAALVGDCAVGAGSYREGAEHLRRFLDGPTGKASPELLAYLNKRLIEAKVHVAEVQLSASLPGVECTVGEEVVKAPTTLYLEPGEYTFSASDPEQGAAQEERELKAGLTINVHLTLQTNVVYVPKKKKKTKMFAVGAVASGVLAAGGFGLMIASAVLHGNAVSDAEALNGSIEGDFRCGDPPDPASVDACGQLGDARDDQNLFSALFTGGMIGGLFFTAAAAAFTGLHFTVGAGGSDADQVSLRFVPTGPGARMEVTW